MSSEAAIQRQLERRYEAGFVTDIESDTLPPGLDEGVVRWISARKGEPEWLTDWRVKAYHHWLQMPRSSWKAADPSAGLLASGPMTRRWLWPSPK